jgi:poly-beta-1,6-N-acetyl-D-glucosamine synthase
VTTRATRYAVITPARDEAANLPRLAESLALQTMPTSIWIIVDNGSRDGTAGVIEELSSAHHWVRGLQVDGGVTPVRGAPIVGALHAGFEALEPKPEIVVNVDADLSFDPTYFEQLLARFDDDRRLGIASGTCYEYEDDRWRQRHVTGTTVWGAARAYRWDCLSQLLPLSQRLGWDGIDELKANARGWHTAAFTDLPFYHHRREGERDGARSVARATQGRSAYYMGYRAWYLAARALYHVACGDMAAAAMLRGYAEAAWRREPRLQDEAAREYLRRQQSLSRLPLRLLEARGRRRPSGV